MLKYDFLDKHNFLDKEYIELVTNIIVLFEKELLDPQNSYYFELSILNNEEIHALNLAYKNKDYPTDVLSFANYDIEANFPSFVSDIDLGEIYISFPKIQEQARIYSKTIKEEFALMLIHGFLHLLSYDHIEDEDAKEMQAMEKYLLEKLFQI